MWVIGFLAGALAALWVAREPIAAKIETVIIHDLNQSGVYPRYASRSWLPWRGLRFAEYQMVLRDKFKPVDAYGWVQVFENRILKTMKKKRKKLLTFNDIRNNVSPQKSKGGFEAFLRAFKSLEKNDVIVPAGKNQKDSVIWALDPRMAGK